MSRIYRIKKNFLAKNGNIYVFTADVIASSKVEVMEAAEAEEIRNWKWVDKIKKPGVQYPKFEHMHLVRKRDARSPVPPGEFHWQSRTD